MDARVYLWRRAETIMNSSNAREWRQTTTEEVQKKQVAVKVHKQSWITKGEKVLYSVVGAVLIAGGFFIVSYSSSTEDRKSTRLNSSHVAISYAVFCLKKKKKINKT